MAVAWPWTVPVTCSLPIGATIASERSWLARQGIHPDKVKVEARGEDDPGASNTTDRGRLMNRRVDGWLLVRPAPPSKPPWYGRVGILGNRDLHPMRRAH